MNLAIDAGNTRIKAGLFRERDLIRRLDIVNDQWEEMLASIHSSGTSWDVVVSSVRAAGLPGPLPFPVRRIVHLDALTPLPIRLGYGSPQTLGPDRIANCVGAYARYGPDCLIVDCGTCLTFTYMENQTLLGGMISPGLHMRFSALHHYTGRLPEIRPTEAEPPLAGRTTEDSILSGVIHGMTGEIDHIIHRWSSGYPPHQVILTGGDASFFAPRLKSRIFADPDLTLTGLNEILIFTSDDSPAS